MTLSHKDESDLKLFFSLGYFEKSTSGPQLERADLFFGRHDANGAKIVRYDEHGVVVPPPVAVVPKRDEDNPMAGLGWSEYNEFGEEITAHPVGGVTIEAKGAPNEAHSELMGRVTKKLKVIAAKHRKVLTQLYGDLGATCEERPAATKGEAHGRIVALYELTPAGQKVAEEERKAQGRSRLKTRNLDLILGVVDGKHGNKMLISDAHQQALALQWDAEAAYTEATYDAQESHAVAQPKPERKAFGDEDM